jgi:alpha-L-fucosidase
VGNERGVAGETNWNTITPDTLFAGKPGIEKLLNEGDENGTAWIPAEVDVSIRPGWFYHSKEDTLVKSGEQLFEIYLTSVGRGSTLLLNIPPDRRGLIHENDLKALKDWKELLNNEFKPIMLRKASEGKQSPRKTRHICTRKRYRRKQRDLLGNRRWNYQCLDRSAIGR